MANPRFRGAKTPDNQIGRGVDLFLKPKVEPEAEVVAAHFGEKQVQHPTRAISIPDFVPLLLAFMDIVLVALAFWVALGSAMAKSTGSLVIGAVLMGCAGTAGLLALWAFRR